jgi:hypothetical protein
MEQQHEAASEPIAERSTTPCIKRTIDGRVYTVLIHFREDCADTAADRMRRVLQNETLNNPIFA